MNTTSENAKPTLAVQAFWLILARTLAFALTLVLPILMVRVFDQEAFGVYRLSLVVNRTITAVLGFGVGLSAFYFLPRLNTAGRAAIIFHIILYHVATGVVAGGAILLWPQLLVWISGSHELTGLSTVTAFLTTLSLFGIFFETVATANQDVVHSTVYIVMSQLTRGAMILAAAIIFRTVDAVLVAWVIHSILQAGALLRYLSSRFPQFWREWNSELAGEQARYILPLGLTGLLSVAQFESHFYLVSHAFNTIEFALYTVGTAQVPLVGILRESVSSVLQPRMSMLQQNNDIESILRLVMRAWRTLAIVFIPCSVGLFVLGDLFITVLYTKQYAGSIPIFRINLLILLMSIFITDSVIRSFAEHRYWLLWNRVIILCIQLVVSAVLIPYTGAAGALWGVVVATAIDRTLNIRFMLRLFKSTTYAREALRQILKLIALGLIAGVVTAAALAGMRNLAPAVQLIGGLAVYAACYLILLLQTGFLDQTELGYINNVAHRFGLRIPNVLVRS